MLDERLPVQQSVTRTLTITTVETWTITIELEQAAPPFQPDRATATADEAIDDQMNSNQQEEK